MDNTIYRYRILSAPSPPNNYSAVFMLENIHIEYPILGWSNCLVWKVVSYTENNIIKTKEVDITETIEGIVAVPGRIELCPAFDVGFIFIGYRCSEQTLSSFLTEREAYKNCLTTNLCHDKIT